MVYARPDAEVDTEETDIWSTGITLHRWKPIVHRETNFLARDGCRETQPLCRIQTVECRERV